MLTRRSFTRAMGFGVAGLTLGGALPACTAESQSVSSQPVTQEETEETESTSNQVIISMPVTSEPAAGFDPFVSWGCGEHVHEPLIQSTLIKTTASMGFENDLATSYECSEDGLTWTFTIRSDVQFSDGTYLSADDVVFTINGIKDSASSECDLTMVDYAEVISSTELAIHMTKPFNALLYTLAVIGIVPEHAYGDGYGTNPIGSGRYMLEQWDQGQQVILVANPTYYGSAPKIERVVVVFMAEDASLAAAKAGQVDVAYTSATFASQQPEGYDLLNCASVDSRGISLPTGAPGGTKVEQGDMAYATGNAVTSDIAVRRAINYGVNRQALITNVLNGYGDVAYSVADGMPWSSDDMKCDTDIDEAKRTLEEAGWVAGTDGIRAKDGQTAEFDLYYSSSDTVRQAIANEFANQMAELGIKVNPKGAGWDEIYAHQYDTPVVWGWGTNSPIETYNLNYSAGNGNYAGYESSVVDGHLNAALAFPRVEDSYDEWKLAMWDGTDGVAPKGAATWVWLANVDHLYFVAEDLKVAKQKPHPHGHGWSLVNNVDEWEW